MGSSPTITLFSVQMEERRRLSSIVLSVVVHIATIVLITLGLMYQASLPRPILPPRYTVRQLDLETPRDVLRASRKALHFPGAKRKTSTASPGGKPVVHPPVLRQVAHAPRAPQTLVQPDVKKPVVLKQKIPVPAVAIWTPEKIQVKKIVAPLPQPPVTMDVTPSLEAPNEAINVDSVAIAPTRFNLQKLNLAATTTTPIVMRDFNKKSVIPATAWQRSSQPSPASVVSMSDLAMMKGTALLPPVNESGSHVSPGLLVAGPSKDNSTGGKGNKTGAGSGSGSGTNAGKNGGLHEGSGSLSAENGQSGRLQNVQGSETGSVAGTMLSVNRIQLPEGGQFGAVVVGDSLGGEFPEAGAVWKGRVAYTVYLHVGLERSWILQYALPRAADAHSAGHVAHLEAPWPYNIVRPNLPPGSINSDALLVHGYVNRSGRFEALSIAFPPDFPQAKFVLKSLEQWQFRPATENGQVAKVEVLLIIPADISSGSVKPMQTGKSGLISTTALIAPTVSGAREH